MNTSIVRRIQRNHALEHATMRMLANTPRGTRLAGHSDWGGFTIYGSVSTDRIKAAASEALQRLKRHQSWLAVHPRCGTNLATGALTTILLAEVSALTLRARWLRVLTGGLAIVAGAFLARPLGTIVQRRVTTSPDLSGAQIDAVYRQTRGQVVSHRVVVTHTERV